MAAENLIFCARQPNLFFEKILVKITKYDKASIWPEIEQGSIYPNIGRCNITTPTTFINRRCLVRTMKSQSGDKGNGPAPTEQDAKKLVLATKYHDGESLKESILIRETKVVEEYWGVKPDYGKDPENDLAAFHVMHKDNWTFLKGRCIGLIKKYITGYKGEDEDFDMRGCMDYIKERLDGSTDGEIRQIWQFPEKFFRMTAVSSLNKLKKELGASLLAIDKGYMKVDGKTRRVMMVVVCWKTINFISQEEH
jgi:hypothetical protein